MYKRAIFTVYHRGGALNYCNYCSSENISVSINSLAEYIFDAIENNFCIVDKNDLEIEDEDPFWSPNTKDIQKWDDTPVRLSTAISFLADMHNKASQDILELIRDKLDTDEYDPFVQPRRRRAWWSSNNIYGSKWQKFVASIKRSNRFFNFDAKSELDYIFEKIENRKTKDGKSIILKAGPNTNYGEFYRARVFESKTKLDEALSRPDLHIASPPHKFASEGRLNARVCMQTIVSI